MNYVLSKKRADLIKKDLTYEVLYDFIKELCDYEYVGSTKEYVCHAIDKNTYLDFKNRGHEVINKDGIYYSTYFDYAWENILDNVNIKNNNIVDSAEQIIKNILNDNYGEYPFWALEIINLEDRIITVLVYSDLE